MLYDVFRFDYLEFQRLVRPVIEGIDHQDYKPLYQHGKRVVDGLVSEWILEDRGTMLELVESTDKPSNLEIGYWLLVLLSSFLRRANPTLTKPAYLQVVLPMIGWHPVEIDLLIYGESTSTLVKPDRYQQFAPISEDNDIYWNWIKPTQANRSGWLSIDRLQELREHLIASEKALFQIEQTALNSLRRGPLTRENLLDAYQTTLAMLQSALETSEGIYIIFS